MRHRFGDLITGKRLLPFIQNTHPDDKYVFWPNKASAHYSKLIASWLNENVKYANKADNPLSVPQARQIKNFWGCLTQKVYESGFGAKSVHQLQERIRLKLKEFDFDYVKSLMLGVKAKFQKIGQENFCFTEIALFD